MATPEAPLSNWQFSAGAFSVLLGAAAEPARYVACYGAKGVRGLSGLDKKLRGALPVVSAHPDSDPCAVGGRVRVDYRFAPL